MATIILISLVMIHFACNAVMTVLAIGKPREAIRPPVAAGVVIVDLTFICMCFLALAFQ